ncbi:urotensin 1 [Gadus macrocephalus]|uniref:urotensin 1 n=1 Tax=Gadus macrocephalus TaxID=80720 RepID=UPI0028CB58BD|nr:urotensin 1 [Gadus macrocephalus]
MKPVPFILLLASVLLASHGRPSAVRTLPARDEALLSAVSDLLGDTLLRVIQRTSPGVSLSLGSDNEELSIAAQMDATALFHLARAVATLETELRAPGMEGEPEKNRVDDLGGLSKRSEEPPISIDLTFHMLRHMIHMARVEREKEQAEMNRHFLDEVGK